MRFFVSIVAIGVAGASALDVVTSPTKQYVKCKRVSEEGEGLVFKVIALPLGARVPSSCDHVAEADMAVLKCGLNTHGEKYIKEYKLMHTLTKSVTWSPVPLELFTLRGSIPCIVMESFAVDLKRLRKASPVPTWSWATVGSIGVGMIDIVEELHTKFGYQHGDLHPMNWMVSDFSSPSLKLIDFGDAIPIASRRVLDVQEVLATVRYLRAMERKFYVWKRYTYDKAEICANIPTVLCDAIEYVSKLEEDDKIDYKRIRTALLAMMQQDGVVYSGKLELGSIGSVVGTDGSMRRARLEAGPGYAADSLWDSFVSWLESLKQFGFGKLSELTKNIRGKRVF